MPTLTDPAVIKELLQRHGFSFSRALGQNFIINPGVCPKMAELGGAAPGVGVLEIGPGFGVLTAELCRRAEKVVAIELDDRLPPILAETLAEFKNVTIVQGDAMVLQPAGTHCGALCRDAGGGVRQPALLYHLAHHHAAAGGATAHSLADGDGAKGGRGAHYGGAGHPGMRGYQRGGVVLQHAEAVVPGLTGVFSAGPGGG